ncbi:MAG TPA: Glu-tRNA(Gln) amidotransferase subunit GatD [Methanomicrobiales archaeon]|nr:Glu-tRNA(Gln) amidotransferase subunit GatD [Methanomicrobiales archaeon]
MTPAPRAGDRVWCTFGGHRYEATWITDRDGMAVVKLGSGYNIGVPPGDVTFREHPKAEPPALAPPVQKAGLPDLAIISTGGTIASRVDYRTGAVTSQFSADDILRAIPGLATIGRFRTEQISSILSENMTVRIWQDLARAIVRDLKSGAAGVIVTHGTDTMAYSAAAISFMVETPAPIIFVGSQRSADRPSSDNAMNALCAATAAVSPLGEVAVVMHETTSDDRCAIHRGTRVRKMHTSRRDAFRSMGMAPLGYVDYPGLSITLSPEAVTRQKREPGLREKMEERCGLVSFYPGMDPAVLEAYRGYPGLVIAGTGLGHVSTPWVKGLASLVRDGTIVVMTSQCLHGRVCDRVYDTGRDLLAAGVIEGEDMLPEVALVKLMWALGQADSSEGVRALMVANLRGEIRRRSLHGL